MVWGLGFNPSHQRLPTAMEATVGRVRAAYEAAGQGHVFRFYDKLRPEEQQMLLKDAEREDPMHLNQFFKAALQAKQQREAHMSEIRPPHKVDLSSLCAPQQQGQQQQQQQQQQTQELLEAYRGLLPSSAACAVVSLREAPHALRRQWRDVGLRLIGRAPQYTQRPTTGSPCTIVH